MARSNQSVTAAFIAVGIAVAKAVTQYGGTRHDLIADAASYAPYIDRLRKGMQDIVPVFLNVFDYDVSERFGKWYSDTVIAMPMNSKTFPAPAACRQKARELVTAYFLAEVRPADILRNKLAGVKEEDDDTVLATKGA